MQLTISALCDIVYNMKRRLSFFLLLVIALVIIEAGVAFALDEADTAADYLVGRGILEGDLSGNLNLDQGLTRAELAVILTRLDFSNTPGGLSEWREWGAAFFSDPVNTINPFTDVPDWALPYIEYCYELGFMKGVSADLFDPQGMVNPKMACTVTLRYIRAPETDWDYDTSVARAQSINLAPKEGVDDDIILRGTMAIIIRRGLEMVKNGEALYYPIDADSFSSQAITIIDSDLVPLGAGIPFEESDDALQPEENPPAEGSDSMLEPEQNPPLEESDSTLHSEQNPAIESDPIHQTEAPPNNSPELTISEMKAAVVRLTNEERAKAGLPPVAVLSQLMDCSQKKADDMRSNNYFGHTSPVYGTAIEMIFQFVPNANFAAENIASGMKTPEEAVLAWMNSTEGHRENILSEHATHIGVGLAIRSDGTYLWVQQFTSES